MGIEAAAGRQAGDEESDPPDLPRLLCLGGKWHGEETDGKSAREFTPVHY
jgi:hypothetical protein